MTDQLIFYGHSPDVFLTAKQLVKKLDLEDSLATTHISDKEFIFYSDQLFSSKRSILIIEQDFLSLKLLRKILCLRRSAWSPALSICVVLAQATNTDHQQRLYTRYGVNLIAANDGDLEGSFWQLLHLAYDGMLALPEFAETKKFFAKAKIQLPVYIERINSLECFVSSDIDLPLEEEFILKIDKEFDVLLKEGKKITSPSVESYAQNYFSYALGTDSSWGVDTSNVVAWDTLETQFGFDYRPSSIEPRKVLLIDSRDNFASLLKTYSSSPLEIDLFHCEANTKRYKNLIAQYWDVILIGSTDGLNEDQRMDLIFEIADRCNSNEDESLIFISNTPSRPEALRKILRYDKVLASGEPLSSELFGMLLPALEKNKESGIESFHTKHSGFGAATVFLKDCIVTSISEFFITFATSELLPAKTVFHLDIGIQLSLVVAPPFRNFSKIGDKHQYGAFIFDLAESDLEILRRAVNYYMHKEVKEIDSNFLKPVIESMKEDSDDEKNQDLPSAKSVTAMHEVKVSKEDVKDYYSKF